MRYFESRAGTFCICMQALSVSVADPFSPAHQEEEFRIICLKISASCVIILELSAVDGSSQFWCNCLWKMVIMYLLQEEGGQDPRCTEKPTH